SGPSSAPPSPERTPPSAPVQVDRSGVPILPDPKLTPGAALPVTTDDICVPGYTQAVRDVPSSVKRQVYEEYGITTHEPGEYEVDHLISLELGGSNSIRNLWPQSYRTQPWNAHVKDALENELHEQVCSGQLDLKSAQREISGNWIESYKKYFHTDRRVALRNSVRKIDHGKQPQAHQCDRWTDGENRPADRRPPRPRLRGRFHPRDPPQGTDRQRHGPR